MPAYDGIRNDRGRRTADARRGGKGSWNFHPATAEHEIFKTIRPREDIPVIIRRAEITDGSRSQIHWGREDPMQLI